LQVGIALVMMPKRASMSDALDIITKFINSPPGKLAAGGVLAGTVWKIFERVEAVLTDTTKFEIAVWLVGVDLGRETEPWPATFAKAFDGVFGTKHVSWMCFWRSCAVSFVCLFSGAAIVWSLSGYPRHWLHDWQFLRSLILFGFVLNAIPNYLSLLKSRLLLDRIVRLSSGFVTASF